MRTGARLPHVVDRQQVLAHPAGVVGIERVAEVRLDLVPVLRMLLPAPRYTRPRPGGQVGEWSGGRSTPSIG